MCAVRLKDMERIPGENGLVGIDVNGERAEAGQSPEGVIDPVTGG
jgi:hypothetical protein